MDRLVGILRTEAALTAQWVRQNRTVDFTESAAVAQAFSEDAAWYQLVDCPVEPVPHFTFLLEDWNVLRDAAAPDAEAVQRVLAATVLGEPASLPPVTPQSSANSPKPTAAHPRAYQGTKYKPPKQKSSVTQDWRPFLCDPRSFASVASEARLPDTFRVSLYPLVRDQDAAEVVETLALYWALGLDCDADRLAAAVYLFSLQTDRNTCAWCRLILTQPPEQWTALLHLLIESGASAAELPPSFGETLAEVLGGKDALYRAYWLLHGLTAQIDPVYLLAGYRLADTYDKTSPFHTVERSGYFPGAAVLAWGEYCRDADDFYAGMLLHLWEQCGLRDGLGKWLERTDFALMTPNAACRWLRLLNSSWDNWGDLSDNEANTRWAAVHPMMPMMTALVQRVPLAYQEKCVRHLEEYLWQWDTPDEIKANLPAAFTLTERLCRPPFAEKNDPTVATTDFLAHLPASLCQRFLAAPDISFKRLEQACRRDNDTSLIGRGTWALTRHQAEFTV